jgi:hypothetical protein
MPSETNQYGLQRYIDAKTRRSLRSEAGFGCVKCGYAFCEYEHIDPEFRDATEHDAAKMAFICKRCHGDVTAGRASKESVWQAKASAHCRSPGRRPWGPLEFGVLGSSIGSLYFSKCRTLLRILGEDLLSIHPPEEPGGPIRLSAKIYDGPNLSLSIEANGIEIGGESWDVEVIADRLTVRRGLREASLVYRFMPERGIVIEHLDMEYRGVRILVGSGDPARVRINDLQLDAVAASFHGLSSCLDVRADGLCLGDLSVLPPRELWFHGAVTFRGCAFNGPLCIAGGSQVLLHNCSARGGVFIENDARLSMLAGVVLA